MVVGGRPFLPGQLAPVGARSPILSRYSLVAPEHLVIWFVYSAAAHSDCGFFCVVVYKYSYLLLTYLVTYLLLIVDDNISMLYCLVFSGLIVFIGSRKNLLNVTIVFFAEFQLQFHSLFLALR